MTEKDYAEGVRDTRLDSQDKRLNDIASRVNILEKLGFMLVGAFALIEVIPAIKAVL